MERHQTLRATVDWSYNLLPPEEQALFRRLAAFLGGWTLEAAESICGDESDSSSVGSDDVLNLLEGLINKSLVVTEDEGGTIRYHMLETISGESETLREKHLEFFLNLAEAAEPHLYRHEQLGWLEQLDADYENLRAALELALGKESAESSLRLCAALGMYWHIRGYWMEGMKWLVKALEKPKDDQNQKELVARIQALCIDSHLADGTDYLERMGESAKSALELAKKIGNTKLITTAEYWSGRHLMRIAQHQEALPLLEKSYNGFRELDEPFWEAVSFDTFCNALFVSGKAKFNSTKDKRLALARKAGERYFLSEFLAVQAAIQFSLNKLEESLKYAEESDALSNLVGSPNKPLFTFALHAWLSGDLKQAELYWMQLYDQLNTLGDQNNKSGALYSLGVMALDKGNLEKAEDYINKITSIWGEDFLPIAKTNCLTLSSRLHYIRGNIASYKQELREVVQTIKTTVTPWQYKYLLIENLNPFYEFNASKTASILGAIDTSEKDTNNMPASPIHLRWCEHAEVHAREVLGDEAFESAFVEGQKLSLEEALDLILESLEETDE